MCPDCQDRGWYPAVRLEDGRRSAQRCSCPAGAELAVLPTLPQLEPEERELLTAVGRSIVKRAKKAPMH